MHRTLWPLILALLLQLVLGSAWAMRTAQPVHPALHACHEVVVPSAAAFSTDHHMHNGPTSADTHPGVQLDSHHCCALCLGMDATTPISPLPQAVPRSPHGSWASLSLRPDLPPPI